MNIRLLVGDAGNPGNLVAHVDPKAAESLANFGLMVLPNDSIELSPIVPTQQNLSRSNGQVSVWLNGYLSYRDEAGLNHTTTFLFRFQAVDGSTRIQPNGTIQGHFERMGFGWNAT
jgi:hypothetical protein